jgi:hypothetical protein
LNENSSANKLFLTVYIGLLSVLDQGIKNELRRIQKKRQLWTKTS